MTSSTLENPRPPKRFIYTKKADLILPEYGRHIHILVEHALRIQDKEERTRCAKSIIVVMGNLFPHLRDVPDFNHKLWDHLAIMSDFKLDIETPFPLPSIETLEAPPAKVPYQHNTIRIKHYGKIVVDMLEQALKEEDPARKRAITIMLGNHMKKSLSVWNKDSVTDERIIADMKILSGNKLEIPEGIRLIDFREMRDNRSAISQAGASSQTSQSRPANAGYSSNPSHRTPHNGTYKKSTGTTPAQQGQNSGPRRNDDRRNPGRPTN